MRRRDLLALLAMTIGMPAPSARCALAKDKLWRIGYLDLNPPPTTERPYSGNLKAFQQGFRELGYLEGRDHVIHARYADTDQTRLPVLAKELVDDGVDVIVTFGSASVRAAKEATSTIPIVAAGS